MEDEVDSFTDRDREESRNASYVRQVINSFLECLDGTTGREGVVVVGACNNPSVMDAAILRPGRLDHHIRLAYGRRSPRGKPSTTSLRKPS
ncbi:ATP-binding protein (plasmid) [Rhizobium ruizarguesonis]|uniref:ATP-binding protein n=1 Tax=Rhizobium ruizarguesonis TaxID=2081791 RepID=A0ACD5EWW3_9HYPH